MDRCFNLCEFASSMIVLILCLTMLSEQLNSYQEFQHGCTSSVFSLNVMRERSNEVLHLLKNKVTLLLNMFL